MPLLVFAKNNVPGAIVIAPPVAAAFIKATPLVIPCNCKDALLTIASIASAPSAELTNICPVDVTPMLPVPVVAFKNKVGPAADPLPKLKLPSTLLIKACPVVDTPNELDPLVEPTKVAKPPDPVPGPKLVFPLLELILRLPVASTGMVVAPDVFPRKTICPEAPPFCPRDIVLIDVGKLAVT